MPQTQTGSRKTTQTARRSHSRSEPDAIRLLTQDHKAVKALFDEYEKLAGKGAPAQQRAALAAEICTMLVVHTQIEEEILYPAAREELKEDEDLLDEAEVEHASAKDLIAQIQAMSPDEPLYDAKVKVLGEYVQHHVKEEEKEMFPQLKKSGADLQELGEQMASRKSELEDELGLSAH